MTGWWMLDWGGKRVHGVVALPVGSLCAQVLLSHEDYDGSLWSYTIVAIFNKALVYLYTVADIRFDLSTVSASFRVRLQE